jgi:hypothetical protein
MVRRQTDLFGNERELALESPNSLAALAPDQRG